MLSLANSITKGYYIFMYFNNGNGFMYLIDRIRKIIDNNKRTFLTLIRNDSEIMKFLETNPKKLSGGNYTTKTKLYWIYHGLTDFPIYVCPVDGIVQTSEGRNIDRFWEGYEPWLNRAGCSNRCVQLNPVTKQKIESTCERKYGCKKIQHSKKWKESVKEACQRKFGSDTPFGSKKVQDKCKQTLTERHGVDNPRKIPGMSERIASTCEIKYGGVAPACSQEVRDKMTETNEARYGVSNGGNTEEGRKKARETYERHCAEDPNFKNDIRERMRETSFRIHGVEDAANSPEANEHRRQTNMERHGVEHIFQSDEVKRKSIETNRLKRGVDYYTQSSEFKSMQFTRKRMRGLSFDNFIKTSIYETPMFTREEYVSGNSSDAFPFKCNICGNTFQSNHEDGTHKHCPICFPKLYGTSHEEIEVSEFICKFVNVIQNDRKILNGKELDIYIPSMKLAIEFDGLYWHSDNNSESQRRHLDKTDSCEKLGIHLVHIFENEWLVKRWQVEYRLKNLLGVYDKTIYARQCEVKEVYGDDSTEFQDANHLQGHTNAKVSFGLYHDGELVSLMTFSKPRFDKKHEWELVRFCNKCGYHVPGGASKLLKHFERQYNPKSIVSYADRRWTMNNGNTLYDRLGFSLDHISKPNYWYIKGGELFNRIQFQKHKLKVLLEHFDESKSEVQNMKDNGYDRIFDCGNLVFVKKYDSRNTSLVV